VRIEYAGCVDKPPSQPTPGPVRKLYSLVAHRRAWLLHKPRDQADGLKAKANSGDQPLLLKVWAFRLDLFTTSSLVDVSMPWTMWTLSRAAIAIVLVVTVFLSKIHLDSISQSHDRSDLQNTREDLYVLNGDAYIELVSAPIATPTARHPTRRKWKPTGRPTPRLVMAESEPKRIPVNVPGAEWDGQDPFFGARRPHILSGLQEPYANLLNPVVQEVQKMTPSSTTPLRPKITPKPDRIIVLGKMSYENTDWLEEQLPE
jgi:hypothetical protein